METASSPAERLLAENAAGWGRGIYSGMPPSPGGPLPKLQQTGQAEFRSICTSKSLPTDPPRGNGNKPYPA